MPFQDWWAPFNSPGDGAGSALANSTVLSDISPNKSRTTIPAGTLYIGQRMRLTAFGIFSTTSTPTLLLGAYYGGVAGTLLAATAAITTGSGAASWPWRLYLDIYASRSAGSSGTVWCNGFVKLGTSLTAMTDYWIPSSQTQPITVDMTAASAITVGAQWGSASSSNTITCEDACLDV